MLSMLVCCGLKRFRHTASKHRFFHSQTKCKVRKDKRAQTLLLHGGKNTTLSNIEKTSKGVTMKNPFAWARVCALALAAALTIAAPMTVAAQTAPATYNTSSGLAMQSVDTNGHTVIVLQGVGDLPGVLTLVLSVAPNGTVTGEWAMNVSYSAPLHPDAQPDPTATDADGAQGDQMIQKGMLSGKISSGSATMANGQIANLNALQLVIVSGSLQFAGVTKGTGTVNAIHLNDRSTSASYLSLTF